MYDVYMKGRRKKYMISRILFMHLEIIKCAYKNIYHVYKKGTMCVEKSICPNYTPVDPK